MCPLRPEALRGDGLPDVRLTQESRVEKQAGDSAPADEAQGPGSPRAGRPGLHPSLF